MEETGKGNGKNMGDGKTCPCGCGACGCTAMGMGGMRRWHPAYMLIRIIVVLFMLAIAFWVGVKLGEFRSEFGYGRFGGGRAYPMMMRNGMGGMMGGYGSASGGSTGIQNVLPGSNGGVKLPTSTVQ